MISSTALIAYALTTFTGKFELKFILSSNKKFTAVARAPSDLWISF
jgi:hypothetical protein